MPSQAFVQVVADTSGVAAQMEREMSQIISAVERSLDPIKVKAELELDDLSLNRTLRDIEQRLNLAAPEVQVRVSLGDLDRNGLNRQIRDIQAFLPEISVNARMEINRVQVITELARMQAFLNARHLTIHADLDIDRDTITRLLAGATTAATTAGASAGAGFSSGFLSAPTITGLGLLLGPVILGAVGTVAAFGIGAAVAGIAFHGFGDAVAAIISGDQDKIAEAMKGLAPSAQDVAAEFGVTLLPVVQDIQDKVQQAFFEPLIGASTDLGNALEKLEPGLVLVADAMGKFIAKLIEMLTSDDNIKLFNQILEDSARIITEVAPYIGEILVGALQLLGFILHNTIDAFRTFKTTIMAPVDGIITLAGGITDLVATIARFVLDVKNHLFNAKTSFADFRTNVSQRIQDARTAVSNFPGYVRQGLSNLGSTLSSIALSAMNRFTGAIRDKVVSALQTLRELPGRARSALGGLGGTLRSSGQSLIQGFIDGIRSKIGEIASAARSAVQAARDFFPFSPAKEGPFSGRGYTSYSGAALIDGFVSGIQSQQSRLQAAMADTLSVGGAGGATPAAAGQTGQNLASGLVPQSSFTSNPNITLIIGSEAIEGAVETVVEGANARRDRQLVQGVRR